MPNHVMNVIEMKGIANLPLFSSEDGKKFFDFNKLIPMPESLNISSGSVEEESIIFYLTKGCKIPLSCLDNRKKQIIRQTV